MLYILRPNDKLRVNYSQLERRVFEALRSYPRDTKGIMKEAYKGNKPPYNALKVISGMLRGLMEKSALNREPFRIMRSKRLGPYPMTFWLDRR